MASLSSGYRNGTSESAKRHERMRQAELKFKAQRDAKAAKLVTAGTVDGEYAACGLNLHPDRRDYGHQIYIEVQVLPGLLKLYLCSNVNYRSRRAQWVGLDAAAAGRALCAGQMPWDIFADWCEEHTPADCDHDWDVVASLRDVV